ncbi:unnamed protein product [Pneumocystis jirovecii]|uniref:Nucleoside diphosphate kinase n=1 Tax=Pneumocystis jirovecii TaxID=42068 RepID=L0PGM8_PNEJI|nr:unnamed protein product [Pneumocystis jirovecii]
MDERTFIAVKPDGVQRGLIGAIITRFEQRGYKLVAIKLVTASRTLLEKHSTDMESGPVCAMVWQGKDVVKTGRGTTNPLNSAPGTIRGDFAIDVGRNVCHGSDSIKNAQREINLWFSSSEIQNWSSHSQCWFYMENLSIETVIEMLLDRFSSTELMENTSVPDRDLIDKKRIVACHWEPTIDQQLQCLRRIYYVFDAIDDQGATDTFKENQKHQYEVRTSAWHCSCPEFAFSAFNNDHDITWDRGIIIPGSFWGGYILGHPIPSVDSGYVARS